MTQKQLQETTEYLISKGFDNPEIGIVLGTGLGKLVDEIKNPITAHYNHIPFFPLATVEFHSGKLIYGELEGKKVVVMQGRFHLYEGYDFIDITYPIRAMHALGVKKLLISNAAGSINLDFKKGDLMLIEDHINLQGGSPLTFKDVARFGDRFVDMSQPYDLEMCNTLIETAKKENISLKKGVYASVVGPQLETKAEYRYLKIIGADAVGMSTVPEVIVANHLRLPIAAISVITDEGDPDNLEPVNIEEIIRIAGEAEPKMITLFRELIKSL
ncbi:purine-nucleoside phosphorylase [Galbibacter pacificus]|uniref:Purine nucleoside phosphorylase n=1 Tax=Galbibacter pacificus TaxID=2996052 RepID=A0ABT6FWT0_9FLAO|nr:purine-nucleoside phosphorylase [Galbibacter pacificus]MDG3584022.1 purine-nucleoside phosphorylase [Galbibacter pacificus]MDG3587541.1 purine-nucleoside phosphorylase [Galbibacter pacificus]